VANINNNESSSDAEDEVDLSYDDLLNSCNTLSEQHLRIKTKFKTLFLENKMLK